MLEERGLQLLPRLAVGAGRGDLRHTPQGWEHPIKRVL
jgi:hypothetical protein